MNKKIKMNQEKNGAWAAIVLWAYQTTKRNATGETLFTLTYNDEVVVSMETKVSTFRIKTFNEAGIDESKRIKLKLIDEQRADALTHLAA